MSECRFRDNPVIISIQTIDFCTLGRYSTFWSEALLTYEFPLDRTISALIKLHSRLLFRNHHNKTYNYLVKMFYLREYVCWKNHLCRTVRRPNKIYWVSGTLKNVNCLWIKWGLFSIICARCVLVSFKSLYVRWINELQIAMHKDPRRASHRCATIRQGFSKARTEFCWAHYRAALSVLSISLYNRALCVAKSTWYRLCINFVLYSCYYFVLIWQISLIFIFLYKHA